MNPKTKNFLFAAAKYGGGFLLIAVLAPLIVAGVTGLLSKWPHVWEFNGAANGKK